VQTLQALVPDHRHPGVNVKQWFKHGVKIVLESNGSPTALLIIICKKPILIFLDKIIPDEEKKE
jgi:hypothetical protein